MKKNVLLSLLFFLVILSCKEEDDTVPFITIDQTEFTLSSETIQQSISFESNMNWTAESSEGWCTVSPVSGGASIKSIVITLDVNESNADRSCIVTIMAGGLSKDIAIHQTSSSMLLVTKDEYQLSNKSNTIEVEVETNIEFDVSISDDWIKRVNKEDQPSNKLFFDITENNSHDSREGTITLKQKDGSLTSIVNIYQFPEGLIILFNKVEEISNNSQSLEVKLQTNIDLEVIIPEEAEEWISFTTTRALRDEILVLEISSNEDFENRSAEIYIKDKLSNLQETLTIIQEGKELYVYNVDKMGTLGRILNATQKDTIVTMILRGEINVIDFDVIKYELPALKYLDLSAVKCLDDKIPNEALGGWPNSHKGVNTVILPLSITKIESQAFYDCKSLTNVDHLPDGLTMIGPHAFYGTKLTGTLDLPKGLQIIGKYAFRELPGLTGPLNIPATVISIGDNAFFNSPNFSGPLVLPEKLKKIEDYTFSHSNLSGLLHIPEEVTTIGMAAFSYCKGFTELTIGNSLTSISDRAFQKSSNLSGTIIFPPSLRSMGAQVFQDCVKVDAYRFPHTTPIEIVVDTFDKGVTVEVPKGSKAAYDGDANWTNYNIVEY